MRQRKKKKKKKKKQGSDSKDRLAILAAFPEASGEKGQHEGTSLGERLVARKAARRHAW